MKRYALLTTMVDYLIEADTPAAAVKDYVMDIMGGQAEIIERGTWDAEHEQGVTGVYELTPDLWDRAHDGAGDDQGVIEAVEAGDLVAGFKIDDSQIRD